MSPLLAQLPPPWDPEKVLLVAEKSQGLWDRNWQSGTAGVLLAVFLVCLGMLLWTAVGRNKDRTKTEAVLVALVKEMGGHVAENGKQTLLFQYMLKEQQSELAEIKRMMERERDQK